MANYAAPNGSPYAQGSSDAKHGHRKLPHWWTLGPYLGTCYSAGIMTAQQIAEYNAGYTKVKNSIKLRRARAMARKSK